MEAGTTGLKGGLEQPVTPAHPGVTQFQTCSKNVGCSWSVFVCSMLQQSKCNCLLCFAVCSACNLITICCCKQYTSYATTLDTLVAAAQKVSLANQVSLMMEAGRQRIAKIPYFGAGVEKVMHVSWSKLKYPSLHSYSPNSALRCCATLNLPVFCVDG